MNSDAGVDVVNDSAAENPQDESPVAVQTASPSVDASPADNLSPHSIADLTVKMEVKGKVVKTDLAGAIVDLGLAQTGFLHISQLSTKRVNNVTDVVKEGDEVTAYVLEVDTKRNRVSLTLIKPPALTWPELKAKVGQLVQGTVVRLEKFGAFVDIGAERPGLVHVSELTDEYISSPEAVVSVGDEVEAKIIGIDPQKKQIDLSMKSASQVVEIEEEDEEEQLTAMALALRKAMGGADREKKRRNKRDRASEVQSDIIARTLTTRKK